MDILTVALVLLVLAGVWLVVELVVSVRKARPLIDEAAKAVAYIRSQPNVTMEEVRDYHG